MAKTPLNLDLLDVDDAIVKHKYGEVTSTFIKQTGSLEFDAEGLFSETIFGEITSPMRLIRFGYITLNTTIIHPRIYRAIVRLKQLYKEIMNRSSYSIWDNKDKDFVRADEID
jgi:hypothetical protein